VVNGEVLVRAAREAHTPRGLQQSQPLRTGEMWAAISVGPGAGLGSSHLPEFWGGRRCRRRVHALSDRGSAAFASHALYDLDLFAGLLNHVADVDGATVAGEALPVLLVGGNLGVGLQYNGGCGPLELSPPLV
jgi:hypothetical protein